MCFVKKFMICDCPATINYDDLPYKPRMLSPLDKIGYPQRCCYCCSLKIAAIAICIVSILWASYEMHSADKFMNSLFKSKHDAFFYFKVFYRILCFIFLLSCGLLLLGIIIQRYELLGVYAWIAFLFCCAHVLFIMVATTISLFTSDKINKRVTLRCMLSVLWTCFYVYLIIVINSYKIQIW